MRCLLILFIACIGVCSYGQTISGIVTDKKTGQTITGAWITSSKATTISGLLGEFTINVVKPADTVRIKMQGYKLYVLPIAPSVNKNVHIALDQAVIELNEVYVTAKRNRLKDSLNNRKMFAREFNSSAPKLKDIIVVSRNPGPLQAVGITIVPSQFIRALTYKHSKEYKFKKVLIRDEQNRYIDSKFGEELVTQLTCLKNDSLLNFMDQYRPSIDQIKKMTDYDIRAYIKASIIKFRSDTLHQTK